MKKLLLIALMLAGTSVNAAPAPRLPRVQLLKLEENMQNAIIDANVKGKHNLGFTFSRGVQTVDIMELTDDIRRHGYKIDEETELLNPRVIHVLFAGIRQEARR